MPEHRLVYRKVKLNIFTLALLAAIVNGALARAEGGADSGGGGSTIDGVTLDSYLAKSRAPKAKLQALSAETMTDLRAKVPSFAAELEKGWDDLDWYMIKAPLDHLPFSRTKIPFRVEQAAVQIDDRVYYDRKKFEKLRSRPGEQGKLVLHELVRRIFLNAEGTNFQVTEGSVYDATEMLSHSHDYSAEELEEKLNRLGFQTRNIPYAKNTRRQTPSLFDRGSAVTLPISLSQPISLENARAVAQYCLNGGGAYSLLRDLIDATSGNPDAYQIKDKYISRTRPKEQHDDFGGPGGNDSSFEVSEAVPSLQPKRIATGLLVGSDSPRAENHGYSLYAEYADGTLMFKRAKVGNLEEARAAGVQNPEITDLKLYPEGGFPVLEFEGNSRDPVYTPFGLTNVKRKVERLTLVANRAWVEGDGRVSLRNAQSNVTTPIRLNGKAYVDCLKTNLEKVSRELVDQDASLPTGVVRDRVGAKPSVMDEYVPEDKRPSGFFRGTGVDSGGVDAR